MFACVCLLRDSQAPTTQHTHTLSLEIRTASLFENISLIWKISIAFEKPFALSQTVSTSHLSMTKQEELLGSKCDVQFLNGFKSSIKLFYQLLMYQLLVNGDYQEFEPWLVWFSWSSIIPAKWKVAGVIPIQGTCRGWGQSPAELHARGNQ